MLLSYDKGMAAGERRDGERRDGERRGDLHMSERLQGWIECRNAPSLWFSKSDWVPAIEVEALLEDTAPLLANPSFSSTIPPDLTGPLAPARGLPSDVSELVAHEAGRWQMPWFCCSLTWTQVLPLRHQTTLPRDWRLVLSLM